MSRGGVGSSREEVILYWSTYVRGGHAISRRGGSLVGTKYDAEVGVSSCDMGAEM